MLYNVGGGFWGGLPTGPQRSRSRTSRGNSATITISLTDTTLANILTIGNSITITNSNTSTEWFWGGLPTGPRRSQHHMHVCIYVSMYLCIYVSIYVCIYVSMYLCIYVSMYIYIYICTHTHVCNVYVCIMYYTYVLSVFIISNRKVSNWASQILKTNMLLMCPCCLKFQIARVSAAKTNLKFWKLAVCVMGLPTGLQRSRRSRPPTRPGGPLLEYIYVYMFYICSIYIYIYIYIHT